MKMFQFILGVVFLSSLQPTHAGTTGLNDTEENSLTTVEITSVSPAVNNITTPPNSNIVLSFTGTIDAALVNANNIVIRGNQTGIIAGTFSGGDTNTITFDPTTDFAPGEIITVTITDTVAVSFTYQFTVRVSAALGANSISNVQQTITTNADGARTVYAADLNNDGDIDVLSASDDDDRIAWYENSGGGFGNPATNQNTITYLMLMALLARLLPILTVMGISMSSQPLFLTTALPGTKIWGMVILETQQPIKTPSAPWPMVL